MESTSAGSNNPIKDLNDLEMLFFRLLGWNTDAQMQKFTEQHLCDILEFAGTNPNSIQKVSELLTHYNKMVRKNPEIKYPVRRLLQLLQGNSQVVSNLSLIYLKFAKVNLTPDVYVELVPNYLDALSMKPNDVSFAYDIVSLAMPGFTKISTMDKKTWPFSLKLSSDAMKTISRVFQSILMFQASDLENMKANIASIKENKKILCPGISPEEYSLIATKIFGDSLNLLEVKLTIVRLLSREIFDEMTSFPLFVVASGVNINAIDDAAESAIKKLDIQAMVDNTDVVNNLMLAYLGSSGLPKQPQNPLSIVQPADVYVKQRILPFLSRSAIAPTTYMNNIKICIDGIGSEFHRVHNSALIFLNSIIVKMPPAALKTLGPSLFTRLRNLTTNHPPNMAMNLVYRCIGSLGKASPEFIFKDISIINEFFNNIPVASDECGYAIVDCLVDWLPAFCNSQTDTKVSESLKNYIASHVIHENTKCRMVSLKYIESLLDENEMDLKWMLLRASGDLREEIREEAIRLLELSLKRSSPSIHLVVNTFWNYLKGDVEDENGEEKTSAKGEYNALIHRMCTKYMWAICETTTTGTPAELRIVEGDDHWMRVAPLIFKKMTELNDENLVQKMMKMALYSTRESLDTHEFRIATCFLVCYRCLSSLDSRSFKSEIGISTCINKLRDSTRMELSQAISYLLSILVYDDCGRRKEMYTMYQSELQNKKIPGICWTMGTLVAPMPGLPKYSEIMRETASLAEILMNTFLGYVQDGYERPSSMLEASLGSIGFVLQNHELSVSNISTELKQKLIDVCEKISSSRKDSLSQKSREAAARLIGWLVGESSEESYQLSSSSLFRIGEGPPQPELQLIVGDALIDSIMGKYSSSRRNYYKTSEEDMKIEKIGDRNEFEVLQSRITMFLTQVVDEKLPSANHHLRRAALVWLLVAVQRFAKLGASALADSSCLSMIQNSFADGLTENDEFTQDVASKGMGIIYSIANVELKKELVSNLMGTLSEGRKTERKVDGNTVLFEKGQLGKTPTGDNLTTYKELCTLATDLNQPDLVYKFMQLAKHNATWNAKKGAAFGFGAVLEQAKDELEPYFGHLVPKLFRYRYDPDLKVQASMRSIWSVLTANRRNVVDEFANEIANELSPALTNKEWRVRESACLALSDLLRGHDTPYMHEKIGEYMEVVLRVRDDIKESVRIAADKAAESIRRLVVRLASSTNSVKADAFLSKVLPMIVDQGIVNSTVKANKIYCLALVLELTKSAGRQLKPYLDKLIPTLLDSISENESSILNYVAVRSDAAQLEALDDARANMARSSPMMVAINDLLPHIDSPILISMTPRLCDQLRASVGVSTRSAAAQLITQLALRAPQLLMDHRPQCDKLFHSLIPGVRDRNPSIRKQFANVMSYLAKFVSSNHMMSLIKTVVADLVTENDELKQSARHVLRNLSANCSELLVGYATQIIPFVFLETCQIVPKGDEAARLRNEEWTELWSELVPSTSSAARLYKKEIIESAVDIIKNNEVWTVRSQAARMIAKTADALGDSIGVEMTNYIVNELLPMLSGRIWTGKEEILNAITKSMEAAGEEYGKQLKEENIEEISQVLKREASKRNVDYSSVGLEALARYCVVVQDVKSASWIADKTAENIGKVINPSERENDSDDEMNELSNLEKEIRISKIVTSNLVALVISLAAYRNGSEAGKSIEQVISHMRNPLIAWKSKQNMYTELSETIKRWNIGKPVEASQIVLAIFDQADEMCEQQKKTVAAAALQVIFRMQEKCEMFRVDWDNVAEKMRNSSAGRITGLSNRLDEKMEVD